MKKLLCFLLCLTLIFSSVSLCFATAVSWDSSDSQHLTEIRNAFVSGGTIYNMINAINSNIVNLNSNLVTLMGWLDPSTGGSTTAILNKILSMLSYTDSANALKSWLADIYLNTAPLNAQLSDLNDIFRLKSYPYYNQVHPNDPLHFFRYRNGLLDSTFTPASTPFFGAFNYLSAMSESVARHANNQLDGFNSSQSYVDWITLNSSSFTPTSESHGIYTWLSKIQNPVARLSYVLASDERIEAQEAAEANEEAVVDNFIDSTGDGSTSPSDIGSVSDLSSGYKQNFGSDASPSGIFDIFNSDHATWFSQETKNQLDTTTPTRLTKGSESETPLLDKQIEDIYNALGVKQP